ncbi:hypothetical protein LTR36_004318 [Oleoguttula mirabilis]|uniref:Uncharacterized protein n=1 Tax=Oleoguttula mirabilis TaxID=1507867 RepID=A0AAV9JHT5_9PEZI|nr:hypothetical protein LTR36_004318 [Oleoguttula mirabilis]
MDHNRPNISSPHTSSPDSSPSNSKPFNNPNNSQTRCVKDILASIEGALLQKFGLSIETSHERRLGEDVPPTVHSRDLLVKQWLASQTEAQRQSAELQRQHLGSQADPHYPAPPLLQQYRTPPQNKEHRAWRVTAGRQVRPQHNASPQREWPDYWSSAGYEERLRQTERYLQDARRELQQQQAVSSRQQQLQGGHDYPPPPSMQPQYARSQSVLQQQRRVYASPPNSEQQSCPDKGNGDTPSPVFGDAAELQASNGSARQEHPHRTRSESSGGQSPSVPEDSSQNVDK